MGAVLALAGPPGVALSETPPGIESVAITGDPVAGAALVASAEVTGDPAPTVTWRWRRCPSASTGGCTWVATGDTYQLRDQDLGFWLRARVTAQSVVSDVRSEVEVWSDYVGPVKAASPLPGTPAPVPTPDPTSTPSPAPPASPPPPTSATSPTGTSTTTSAPVPEGSAFTSTSAPVAPAQVPSPGRPIALMSPFPIVRIKGRLGAAGADVSLFTISAPRGVTVTVRCIGTGCPVRRLRLMTRRSVTHVRPLERLLRAGLRLQISVTRPGVVGKHTTILIRRGRPPLRSDRCLVPGRLRPTSCPA